MTRVRQTGRKREEGEAEGRERERERKRERERRRERRRNRETARGRQREGDRIQKQGKYYGPFSCTSIATVALLLAFVELPQHSLPPVVDKKKSPRNFQ